MQYLRDNSKKKTLLAWTVFLILLTLLAWRLIMPKPGLDVRGLFTWIEIVFLLILCVYINLTGFGLGQFLLKRFDLPLLTKTESSLLALMIGLGAFSMGVMIIGLAGWLNALSILVWLAVSGFIAFRELLEVVSDHEMRIDAPYSPHPRGLFEILLQIIIFISIPLLLISVTAPVWDYDALLYHLEVPRQFLAEGRIYFNSETWRSAYPFLGEMPFIVGIIFGLDPLGKLINLTYAVLLVGSAYVFSLRFWGRQVALTATAILIGAPAFLLWATWVSVDYAWASYEFWSIYAISLWLADDHRTPKWLALAGIMSGFAASIKYLSIPALLIAGSIVAWKSMEGSKQPVRKLITNLLTFASSAGLVMGVWYIKNWLWTGNPVYPLVFGGPGWDPLESQVLNDYVQTFGVGKTWLDYLLLPFNVYAYQDRFSTIPIEVIHPALWLGLLFPFVGKSNKTFNVVLVYAALYFIAWVITSQVIRFLIPLTAFAAIIAGSVIEKSPSFLKNFLKFGLLGGLMVLSLIHQIATIQNTDVWGYFIGQKSAAQILQKVNNNFTTITYIQSSLAPNDRVLFLWDGRGYYCDSRCIPDDEQSIAIRLAFESPSPQKLASDLHKEGITHLMLSKPDASWFISYHDPRGLHRNAFEYLTKKFLPVCGKSLFQDGDMELFEIDCH